MGKIYYQSVCWYPPKSSVPLAKASLDSSLNPSLGWSHLLARQVPCPSVFSEPSKTLSVVIPAYNEEGRLPATLAETLRWAGTAGLGWALLVKFGGRHDKLGCIWASCRPPS
jgi:hypothetical protein